LHGGQSAASGKKSFNSGMKNLNNIIAYISNSSWFGGPIFTKELLISSRRRRNYFVRFAYPVVLTAFVVSAWAQIYMHGVSTTMLYQVSHLAQIGKDVTTAIVWFQFIAVQVLAVIMLSTAISDEIYHKTLGVLMTTPITSLQVVMGKLLSKLLQLILIIAISFPILAIIRVFGGVPWNYVLSSICITLTSAIFAGSLSLFFSIYSCQSQSVIARTVLACFFLYAIPLIVYQIVGPGILGYNYFYKLIPRFGLFFINPFLQMISITRSMNSPSPSVGNTYWLLHCVAMLGLSAALMTWSSISVRKTGLRQITGQAGLFLTRRERKIADKKQQSGQSSEPVSDKIRDIKWQPVIWREISTPLFKMSRVSTVLSFISVAAFLIFVYGLCYHYEVLFDKETQIIFVLAYFFVGLIRTSSFASTSITAEKEAGTWSALLTSPLTEEQISYGKIIGSCLRARQYWILLSVHLLVFILAGKISVRVVIPLTLLVISSSLLVSAIGVMFSSICRRSTTAASWNVLAFLALTIPVCCFPLFLGSPLFAAYSIFGVWGGTEGILASFSSSPVFLRWFVSWFSFIIYVIAYLLVSFGAYVIAADHMRWRILH
jgi:ABC-type transport system involved in multi-copper enzyme maturation permease subunit